MVEEMINPAINSKEHVKYEATQSLSVTYQHDRLHLTGKRLQQRSQGPQQQQCTPSSKESSRGKKTPNAYDAIRDECVPLTCFFRGYCRLLLRPSRVATGGTIIFPLIFCVENVWYTLASCHKIS